ncbi:hypothetical protein Tco_1034363 [Tanacetum coccineum]
MMTCVTRPRMGDDDTVESGNISILNSLIGHGSPHSLQLCGTIGTTEVLIDKEVDKEVQYNVYTLHVLISFLKRLNDQYIKKKKMKAAMQRRLWDSGIKKKGIILRARSNISQEDCFIPFDIKQSFSRLVNLLEVKQHVSTSVKEIDNVQLGIVNQAELKLLPRVLL